MAFAYVFLVILLAAPLALAADHPITWSLGADYSSWTTKSVNVGDKLVFTYDGTHTVDIVDKSTYDNCGGSKPMETHTSSPTTITLKEGTTYIICGAAGHCAGGMKLQVTAMGSGSSPAPSGTETPSPSTPTSPSNPTGNGASTAAPLWLGTSIALCTLFAFMG